MVYDDTEESSALESEEGGGGGGGGGGRGVMARVMSLERRGVRMVDTKDRQGASNQGGGMFTSNKETVRKLVEEEMRSKVPRNKSFKQAVGAGLGHGQGSPSGERRRRRRKSLEEQLVRNTEVRTRRAGRSKNPQNLAKVKS